MQQPEKSEVQTQGSDHSGVSTVSLGTLSDKQKWDCPTSFPGNKDCEVLVGRTLLLGTSCWPELLLQRGSLHKCPPGKEQNCSSLLILLSEKEEASPHPDTQKLQWGFQTITRP